MTMDREKEREIELESAMYNNCLLLGLDPAIIGVGVGQFRHSNPKLGERLLYFILSSLRGPAQSAKDLDKVWPIFDSSKSRDFRKVVQGIISELESQGELPRSNSRVSSLATCCGPRFVELLWQLSLHALREVHKRTFAADVASNPLPASLTDVSFSHAAALLPVMKARIALERRRFLKNAEKAVHQQAMWSSLAHEITAEYRGLCAEEAYLQQELEKLHDLRQKIKLEGELWEDLVSSSSQNSHLFAKATRLWDSILARKGQHEALASGPIEDLIAHREHRYRISGSALLAAMDQSSQGTDASSMQSSELASIELDAKELSDGSNGNITRDRVNNMPDSFQSLANEEIVHRGHDRTGRALPTVDIAEIFRRWTHALQRIQKQSLHLAKANDGEGPEILRNTINGGSGGHADFLAATLAEHQQHLASFQVLLNQLKEVAPAIQKSIAECTENVNSISSRLPSVTKHSTRMSPIQESSSDDTADVTSKMSTVQFDKMSSSPTLKLPQLFSSMPNSSGKNGNVLKRQTVSHQSSQIENLSERKSSDQAVSINRIDNAPQDSDNFYVQNLKKSVREAALSTQLASSGVESSRSFPFDESVEHFFVPVSATGFPHLRPDGKGASTKTKNVVSSQVDASYVKSRPSGDVESKFDEFSETLIDLDSLNDFDQVNGFLSKVHSKYADPGVQQSFFDIEETEVFSPPLLTDRLLLADSYEDLLAPLSEAETALMERRI